MKRTKRRKGRKKKINKKIECVTRNLKKDAEVKTKKQRKRSQDQRVEDQNKRREGKVHPLHQHLHHHHRLLPLLSGGDHLKRYLLLFNLKG